jgi:hypothetical protein
MSSVSISRGVADIAEDFRQRGPVKPGGDFGARGRLFKRAAGGLEV